MADQSSRSQDDVVQALGEPEVVKALNREAVARALNESAIAGGAVGLALAGGAFLAARFARLRRRRTAAGRAGRGRASR